MIPKDLIFVECDDGIIRADTGQFGTYKISYFEPQGWWCRVVTVLDPRPKTVALIPPADRPNFLELMKSLANAHYEQVVMKHLQY